MTLWDKFVTRYRVYAKLHQRKLDALEDEALDYISTFHKQRGDTLLVGFSGGKDSMLMLHLVRKAGTHYIAFWGAADTLGGTLDFIKSQNVRLIDNTSSPRGFIKQYGQRPHWSNPPEFDLVINSGRELDRLWGISGSFVGIRRDESVKRRYALTEVIRPVKGYAGGWRCAPIASWKTDDVWAYTIANNLPINPVYVDLVNAGAPEQFLRVDGIPVFFETERPAYGALQYAKRLYPNDINRFLTDNPYLIT